MSISLTQAAAERVKTFIAARGKGLGLRLGVRKTVCARFTTVLGPGSDGYHENHVHMDLAERASGHRMCQWDVRDPEEEAAAQAHAVPLPTPRPASAGP